MPYLKAPRYILLALLLPCLLAALAACALPAAPPKAELRIGVLVSEGGTNVTSTLRAAELIVEEVNEAGGLLVGEQRQQVILVTEVVSDSPETAVAAAQRLINQEDIVALVGPQVSRIAIPVANIAEQSRIPMISPASTHPETTAGKQYVFRAAFIDPYQGEVMARFALEELGVRRVALLYDIANEYNRGISEIFRRVFEEEGGEVVAFESYTTDQEDFQEPLARIQAANPEALFLPNFSDAVLLQAQQARQMGIEATLLGSDSWNLRILGGHPEMEGAFYTHHWHPDVASEPAARFTQQYQERYGEAPTNVAALTYDAFGLLFQAITAQGKTEPDSIRAGLAGISHYQGVTGEMEFQGTGDPIKSVVILQVLEGKATLYRISAPE